MATGKWCEPGVPHKGWTCVGIEDLGPDDRAICEMCEVQLIRYVHTMTHPEYQELACGCVCAGHMEEDLKGARVRETAFKNSRARRKKWLTRTWYRDYASERRYLNTDRFHIAVWPKLDGSYAASVKDERTGVCRDSKLPYDTMDAAKLATFDVMIQMREKRK